MDKINQQIADQESAKIDHAELMEEDKPLRKFENDETQRILDDTLHALTVETDMLLKLMDRVQKATEDRNKTIKETIEKLNTLL
jgi:preprotein translocase subunit SecA